MYPMDRRPFLPASPWRQRKLRTSKTSVLLLNSSSFCCMLGMTRLAPKAHNATCSNGRHRRATRGIDRVSDGGRRAAPVGGGK